MHLRRAFHSLLLLCALPPAAGGQAVSWFVGPPGGVGDITSFDESSAVQLPQIAQLSGIQFLPVDFVGRTSLNRLREDRARLESDVAGAARIVLPQAGGSIYRYRRDDLSTTAFGFFHLDSGGTPHVLFEVSTNGSDPFLPKVGMAFDGGAFLAATTVAAGGDVFEIDLQTGATNRTSTLAPLAVQQNGLGLLDGWGVVVTDGDTWRFDRASSATPTQLTYSGTAPAFLGDCVVGSSDGTTAVVTGGASASSLHVWAFASNGPASCVSSNAGTITGGGFLPETPDGPYLALSSDGSTCLWRTEEPTGIANETTGEVWARLTRLAAPTAVQISADARFEDTLDSTGDFDFFNPGRAVVLVGEEDENGGIDGGDLYQVDIDPVSGVVTTTNLSGTSGVSSPPFVRGTLKSEAGIYRVPGTASLLVHEDLSSGEGNLGIVTGGVPGFRLLKSDVAEVASVGFSGGHIALMVKGTNGFSQFLSVPPSLSTANVLATLGGGFEFARLASGMNGWASVLIDVPGGGQWIGRLDTVSGFAEVLVEVGLPLGQTVGFTPTSVGFTVDVSPQRSFAVRWGGGVDVGLFPVGNRPAYFLPVF